MVSLPSPPVSRSASPTPSASLDDLLESYLNLLDTYTLLRTDLSKHLASGFFSLAQANFANSTGTRYGRDLYDDRMRAALKVDVRHPNVYSARAGNSNVAISIKGSRKPYFKPSQAAAPDSTSLKTGLDDGADTSPDEDEGNDKVPEAHVVNVEPTAESADTFQLRSPPVSKASSPAPENSSIPPGDIGPAMSPPPVSYSHSKAETQNEEAKQILDPIRQFGILVPPALRAAQGSFTGAVDTIVELLNAERQLIFLEAQIGAKRKILDATVVGEREVGVQC